MSTLNVSLAACSFSPNLLDASWQFQDPGDELPMTAALQASSHSSSTSPRPTDFVVTITAVTDSVRRDRRELMALIRDCDTTSRSQTVRIDVVELGITGTPVVEVEGCVVVADASRTSIKPPAAAAAAAAAGAGAEGRLRRYKVTHVGRSPVPRVMTCNQTACETKQGQSESRATQVGQCGHCGELTATVTMDEASSRLTASVNWNYACDDNLETVRHWQLTVTNLTWLQNDCAYHRWIFTVDRDLSATNRFLLPLWLRCGNRYMIVVRGLKPSATLHDAAATAASSAEFFSVECRTSVEFRAGQVLSKEDMHVLLQKAIDYRAPASRKLKTLDAKCNWFQRNKPLAYFQRIDSGDGQMRPYLKDASGDLRCPVNGEIDGLFFLATPRNAQGQPHRKSPFGNARITVRAPALLDLYPNMYFADFSCLLAHPRKLHHVTLVLTQTDSDADRFCREHLPALDVTGGNPFLFRRGGELRVARSAFVDIFVTEDVDVRTLIRRNDAQMHYNVRVVGPGTTTQGGRQKTARCPDCDIVAERPMASTPPLAGDIF